MHKTHASEDADT